MFPTLKEKVNKPLATLNNNAQPKTKSDNFTYAQAAAIQKQQYQHVTMQNSTQSQQKIKIHCKLNSQMMFSN